MHDWRLFEGIGSSMHPTVRTHDALLCELAPERVARGDLAVFSDVVHRLLWLDPWGGVWECGDAPGSRPRRRRRSELQGRVAAAVRDGRWISTRASLSIRVRQAVALGAQMLRSAARRLQ